MFSLWAAAGFAAVLAAVLAPDFRIWVLNMSYAIYTMAIYISVHCVLYVRLLYVYVYCMCMFIVCVRLCIVYHRGVAPGGRGAAAHGGVVARRLLVVYVL